MEINKSYLRGWADSEMEALKSSDEISIENLFTGLMYGLATFARDEPSESKLEKFIDINKHYSNDSALFEVGCYLYFRVDLWLFKNKPNLREKISAGFIKEFNKLFSKALGIVNSYIHELFNERINKYGEMIRKGEEIKTYHFYLSQLILYTKDGSLPGKHDFKKMKLVMNFFDDWALKMKLLSWETTMLPSIIGSLEKYCNLLESKL